MIESFHHQGGYIRKRVPLVKIVASAITIGSGGSAGQRGAHRPDRRRFWVLSGRHSASSSPRIRRILVLAGAAGGIGAIFHAPLGAALFAPEVLYREAEFESEAILPCIVSAIVASSIFDQSTVAPPFSSPGPVNFEPRELIPYLIFGGVMRPGGIRLHQGLLWHAGTILPPSAISPIS